MLQSENPSLHKTKKTKSEPKQSLIRADLQPGLAFNLRLFSGDIWVLFSPNTTNEIIS